MYARETWIALVSIKKTRLLLRTRSCRRQTHKQIIRKRADCREDTVWTLQSRETKPSFAFRKFILSTAALSQSVFNIIKHCNEVVTSCFWFRVIASLTLRRHKSGSHTQGQTRKCSEGRVKRLDLYVTYNLPATRLPERYLAIRCLQTCLGVRRRNKQTSPSTCIRIWRVQGKRCEMHPKQQQGQSPIFRRQRRNTTFHANNQRGGHKRRWTINITTEGPSSEALVSL